MANNKIFVSPGVYTKEIDLSTAATSIGVTTLGVVGETLKGPAFEPILITSKNNFLTRFGAQSAEKFSNGVPKYELPYIANTYLEQSNDLYVTRVLGLSGYDAGKAWSINTIGGLDPATAVTTIATGTTTFTSTTTGTTFSAGPIQALATKFDNLPVTVISSGSTFTVSTGSTLTYTSGSFTAKAVALHVTTLTGTTGTASYSISTTTGTPLTAYDNVSVAVLRSRGSYVGNNLVYNTDTLTMTQPTAGAFNEFTLTSQNGSYTVSLDDTKSSLISKAIGVSASDNKTDVFVEKLSAKKLRSLVNSGKVFGISTTLGVETGLHDYKTAFATPETPWLVSELRGNQVQRLFKFVLISDGDDANKEVKISIENIDFSTREFDVIVRDFNDTDAYMTILEAFRRCSLNPTLNSYIGKRIGTNDGTYDQASNYIMVDIDDNAPVDAVASGFEGYSVMNLVTAKIPQMLYKTAYDFTKDKPKKAYLGISDITGIDQSMFNFIGNSISTGKTKGFHLDINADVNTFEVGTGAFNSDASVIGTDYASIGNRKFTVCASGGFDGWDIYRTSRTNTDDFRENQANFESNFTTTLPSDYYAYRKAIRTFANADDIAINLFATAGIDYDRQNGLVQEVLDMMEDERKDALYIVTTPDQPDDESSAASSVDTLKSANIDSNYACTYGPWTLHADVQNGVNIYLPPTFEVVRDMAETDKTQAPWFAVGGYNRGQLNSKRTKYKINQDTSDILYAGRINPIRTFSKSPLLIMGNKTLQQADTALNRINVRRLLLQIQKLVAVVAIRLVFEPNDTELQDQFKRLVNPILADVKKQRGIIAFEVTCDDSNNSNADRDQLQLNGSIRIKPTNATEYINLTYGVTDQGATFDNI